MLQKLTHYNNTLTNILTTEKDQLQKITSSYIDTFTKQLKISADRHWKQYQMYKKSYQKELAAVQYYLKLSEYEKPQQEDEGQQSVEKRRELWTDTMKSVNLYSLFKQIDDKLAYNSGMLDQLKFVCILPAKGDNHYQQLLTKLKIHQQQTKQYSKLISTLFTKLTKPQKTLYNNFILIEQKYKKLLNNPYCSTCPQQNPVELKVKDSINYIVSAISNHKYLRSIDIEIISDTGIMSEQDYQNLADSILQHRYYIKILLIKIMDMQFCQQKCNILTRKLKKLKIIQKLIIQNYYSQCKLGQFVDFGWMPFRKQVNIKSGVWK